jgi:hypothetical protein
MLVLERHNKIIERTNMTKKLKWYDLTMVIGILTVLLINPLTGQYIIQGIVLGYEQLLLLGDYFMVAGITLVAVGYLANRMQAKDNKFSYLRGLKEKPTQKAGKYVAQ